MKKKTIYHQLLNYISLLVLFGVIPLLALSSEPLTHQQSESDFNEQAEESKEQYLLYDDATKQELKISAEDYMLFATACEMPISYECEALRAQAVAAYTYLRYRAESTEPGKPILHVNTETYTGYTTQEKLEAFWGKDFETHFQKLKDAVLPVVGQMATYEKKPILAAYFAVSSGQTEDSGFVWGESKPYLHPVEIGADLKSDHYRQTSSVSQNEVKEILKKEGIVPAGDAGSWFESPVYSASNTLLSVEISGRKITGQQLRSLFSLPSACIRIDFEKDQFTFTTYGYGHGVGLSQFGANELARAGMDYKEILAYFYHGIEIRS